VCVRARACVRVRVCVCVCVCVEGEYQQRKAVRETVRHFRAKGGIKHYIVCLKIESQFRSSNILFLNKQINKCTL